jgi:hypothetical protein
MKHFLIITTFMLVMTAAGRTTTLARPGQGQAARVGSIDFFGYAGLNVDQVLAALPIHEGDKFASVEALKAMRPKIEEAVRRVTGRPASDVATISPGKGLWLVYIGLSGNSMKPFPLNPTPAGTTQLPAAAMEAYKQVDDASMKAMQKGAAGEDDSKGYSLSSDDPELRAKQLAMHEYAAKHEDVIRAVLRSSANTNQRQIAAELLGYVNQSIEQINDLVWASHDPDPDVRNNATRALGVLTNSDPRVAAQIPADGFIEMLNSGSWFDRNKAGFVLLDLSKGRSPRLLAQLRARALASLLEMARWHSAGHANAARMLLGRIAGIEETRLVELVVTDKVDVIINAVQREPR